MTTGETASGAFWLFLIAMMFVSPVVCGIIASGKNRPPALWALIGLLVPVVGIVVIASLPREEAKWERDKRGREDAAVRGMARERMKTSPAPKSPRHSRRRS